MAINRRVLAQNIVLVAESINVTSFSQYWFIKNGIFGEEEFKGSVFTPGLVLIAAPECQLTILPNQIQLELKSDDENVNIQCIKNRMVKLIKCLANVRVSAMGLNYIWKLTDNERTVPQLSKSLFGNSESSLMSYFKNADSRYGAYFSQDVDPQTRLKLDIKPTIMKENGQNVDMMMYNFNFHCDVQEQQMEETIMAQLKKWHLFNQLAKELVCL